MHSYDENLRNKTQCNFNWQAFSLNRNTIPGKQVLNVNKLKTYNNENTFLAQYLSNHCSHLERVFIVALILHLSSNC